MAQKQERRVAMKKNSRTTSDRGALFARFLLFARFTNHRMTGPGLGMKAFGPSWGFSSQLRRWSRSAQLVQKGGHGPRSEERRVGKEWRCGGWRDNSKKKQDGE